LNNSVFRAVQTITGTGISCGGFQKMKKNFSRALAATSLFAALMITAPVVLGQTQSGSPLVNPDGSAGRFGMSPQMKANGPMAPQNNVNFTEQHVSDTIRENMAIEIGLSEMALKHSRSAVIKKFAQQVILENSALSVRAKQLAPDKSGSFPNPIFEGTRQSVEGHAEEKKMSALTGPQFDRLYVNQMYKYAQNDQQVGHGAYALMEFPGISPVGRTMWDMANTRVKQIEKLAKDRDIKLQ
jgi:predicted outer membrane protein